MTELVFAQVTDLFRIGLIIGLVITMHRTAAVTGRLLPLILGVVFVAAMLPATMPSATVKFADALLAGVVSNLIILVPVLLAAWLIQRLRR